MCLWLSMWIFSLCFYGPVRVEINPQQQSLTVQDDMNASNVIDTRDINVGMPQVFRYQEFWLLYAIFFIITGCGLLWLNNISQIVEAASEHSDSDDNANDLVATALVTASSIGNFSGRLSAGILSDRFRHRLPRVFWAQVSSISMCLSYVYFYLLPNEVQYFYPGAFMVGFSFGLIFTTTISSAADLWGTRYLSGNYAFLDSAPIFSSFLMATYVFSAIYTKQGNKENDGNKCWGQTCYRLSFAICALSAILALILAFYLWRIVQKKHNDKIEVQRKLKEEKAQNLLP
mmetsp:Transcript_8939/g.14609  ORF Transcript_8939/g.14609 Transcript_8939/m.14609 type:complete len:288 (+) Transcript_8939:2-865(+)